MPKRVWPLKSHEGGGGVIDGHRHLPAKEKAKLSLFVSVRLGNRGVAHGEFRGEGKNERKLRGVGGFPRKKKNTERKSLISFYLIRRAT